MCHVGKSCGCQSGLEGALSLSRRKAEGQCQPLFLQMPLQPLGLSCMEYLGQIGGEGDGFCGGVDVTRIVPLGW